MQRAIGELRRPKAELTALAECGLKATIEVRLSLEDENAEEARLIGRAVAKAKANAEALAAACGKRPGDVRLVTYNRPTDGFVYPGDFCVSAPGGTGDLPDLNPEPIEVECAVDMDWYLE